MQRGVFVHQFDASQDFDRPWLVNTSALSFTSLSIASAAFPYVYSTSLGGMLFSYASVLPEDPRDSPVRCACACDCNSYNAQPSGCANVSQLAGSMPEDNGCLSGKDTNPFATAYRTIDDMLVRLNPRRNDRCVWTPTKPYDRNPAHVDSRGRPRPPPGETIPSHFSCMYNEIVADGAAINRAVSATTSAVDAFFFTSNCWRDPTAHMLALPTDAKAVKSVYAQFMADRPSKKYAPLFVAFDCAKLARAEPPFVDASGSL